MGLLLWYSGYHSCNKLTMLITPVDNPLVHVKIMNHMLCPVPVGEEGRTDLSHQARSPKGGRERTNVGAALDRVGWCCQGLNLQITTHHSLMTNLLCESVCMGFVLTE